MSAAGPGPHCFGPWAIHHSGSGNDNGQGTGHGNDNSSSACGGSLRAQYHGSGSGSGSAPAGRQCISRGHCCPLEEALAEASGVTEAGVYKSHA